MHRLTALLAAVALLPAFVLAPFTHVHIGGSAKHEGSVVHTHFSPHASHEEMPSPVPAIDDNDQHRSIALQLDFFQFSTHQPLAIPDLPTTGFVEPEVRVMGETWEKALECSHDPPLLRTSGFRAPPV